MESATNGNTDINSFNSNSEISSNYSQSIVIYVLP